MRSCLTIAAVSFVVFSPLSTPQPPDQSDKSAAADGGRIYYQHGLTVKAVRPDGRDARDAFQADWLSINGRRNFSISPDGSHVVFSKDVPGKANFQVFVLPLKAKGLPVDLGLEGQYVSWSADGTRVAASSYYDRSTGDEHNVHWVVEVKTGRKSALKLPFRLRLLDWSPDGKWLLVRDLSKRDGKLVLLSLDGSEARPLAGTEMAWYLGRFSPDGRKVLFSRWGAKKTERLYVLDLGGGEPRPVNPELDGGIRGLCWSPDGKRVAYTWVRRDPEGKDEQEVESFLMVCDLDGANARVLVSEKGTSRNSIDLWVYDWR